jgi:hypothetical protein
MSNVTKSTAFAYIPKKLFGMKKQSIKQKLKKPKLKLRRY